MKTASVFRLSMSSRPLNQAANKAHPQGIKFWRKDGADKDLANVLGLAFLLKRWLVGSERRLKIMERLPAVFVQNQAPEIQNIHQFKPRMVRLQPRILLLRVVADARDTSILDVYKAAEQQTSQLV